MKQNGKSLPAKMGPVPSMNCVRGGKLQARVSEQNAEGEQQDHAEFDKGAEIIARGKQQPHGQRAGGRNRRR